MKKSTKRKGKTILSVIVAGGLVLAIAASLLGGRFAKEKPGKLVSVSVLDEEEVLQPHYQREAFQGTTEVVSAVATTTDASEDEDIYANLSDDDAKDLRAMMTLKENNELLLSGGQSFGDKAKSRSDKYQLNEIKEITITTTGGVTPGTITRADSSQGTYLGRFILTGYCPCVSCCGKTDGITAAGTHATSNHTIATDARYSFGTQMIINGQLYTVEDRGGAIQGNHIDIYFDTHQEALNFGKQEADVFLYTAN